MPHVARCWSSRAGSQCSCDRAHAELGGVAGRSSWSRGSCDTLGGNESGVRVPIVRACWMSMSDFLVKRDNHRECQVADSSEPEPAPGQALLRVDSFGLTANNITYAVMGEIMSYWDFFPAADGWGRVPMWGFAEVERSEAEGVEPGLRLYGDLPPSS